MTRFELRSSDASFSVETRRTGSTVEVSVNGKPFVVKLEKTGGPSRYTAYIGGDPVTIDVETISSTVVALKINGEKLVFQRAFAKIESPPSAGGPIQDEGGSLVAPMPGRIIKLQVEKGQSMKKGDPLVVIESMKMESILRSNRNATVNEILVVPGDSVKRGQELVRFRVQEQAGADV